MRHFCCIVLNNFITPSPPARKIENKISYNHVKHFMPYSTRNFHMQIPIQRVHLLYSLWCEMQQMRLWTRMHWSMQCRTCHTQCQKWKGGGWKMRFHMRQTSTWHKRMWVMTLKCMQQRKTFQRTQWRKIRITMGWRTQQSTHQMHKPKAGPSVKENKVISQFFQFYFFTEMRQNSFVI